MAFLWVRKNGKIALSGGMELRCFHRRSSKVIRAQKACDWQQQTVKSKHLWRMPAAANTSCADHFDHFSKLWLAQPFFQFSSYDRRAVIEFILTSANVFVARVNCNFPARANAAVSLCKLRIRHLTSHGLCFPFQFSTWRFSLVWLKQTHLQSPERCKIEFVLARGYDPICPNYQWSLAANQPHSLRLLFNHQRALSWRFIVPCVEWE